LQPASAVTNVQSTPSADDQTLLLHAVPGTFRPPMSHILPWNSSETDRSVCTHGPASRVRTQSLPSDDFHTSSRLRAFAETQPPRIQRCPSWTNSPCESRARQGAASVTRTQSGPRLTAAPLDPPGGACAAAHWQIASTTTQDVQVVAIVFDFIFVG